MEEYLLEYIFENIKDDLIKGNDYPVLLYLLKKSYQEGFTGKIKITLKEATEELGFTPPTLNSSLERLEFAGHILTDTEKGRNGYTEVTICFIDDLLSTRHFEEGSTRHEEKVLNSHAPRTKDYLETRILSAEREDISTDLKYKEVLQYVPVKYKDSLHLRVENIKKFYNLFILNIKKFYNLDGKFSSLDGKYKDSLHLNAPYYKVSLHFIATAKSLNINDLTDVSPERYRNLRSFFAKIGTIYNKKYINIINIIDNVFFNGKLFDAIEDYVIQEKSTKGSSNYSSKDFELNDDTMKHIPLRLHEHSETVLGERITFIESYQNWLDYKRNDKGDPVGYNSALRELKWLATIDNPVESIETSIRKTANGIFHVQSNYQKFNKNSNDNSGDKQIGNVKRFD